MRGTDHVSDPVQSVKFPKNQAQMMTSSGQTEIFLNLIDGPKLPTVDN